MLALGWAHRVLFILRTAALLEIASRALFGPAYSAQVSKSGANAGADLAVARIGSAMAGPLDPRGFPDAALLCCRAVVLLLPALWWELTTGRRVRQKAGSLGLLPLSLRRKLAWWLIRRGPLHRRTRRRSPLHRPGGSPAARKQRELTCVPGASAGAIDARGCAIGCAALSPSALAERAGPIRLAGSTFS